MFYSYILELFRRWPVFQITTLIASLASINIAGLVRQIPTAIRQLLDPSFFANHIASLGISLAYALLMWRVSAIFFAFLLSVVQQIPVPKFAWLDKLNAKFTQKDTFIDIVSRVVGMVIALQVFSYSHFGSTGFVSIAQFSTLLLIIFGLYAVWEVLTRNPKFSIILGDNTATILKSKAAPNWVTNLSNRLTGRSITNMTRAFVAVALILSFYLGELRLIYLTTQDNAQIQVGDIKAEYKIIGSTTSGVIASYNVDTAAPSKDKKIAFGFFPYDAITYVIKVEKYCFVDDIACAFERAGK